jgi:glycosyltransferase involved in cell wall biosynthesis
MSKDTSIIWMNLTTSEDWTRPAVGIVRTERELCAELSLLYGSRFKKCIWLDGQFIELDISSINNKPVITENNNQSFIAKAKEYPLLYPLLSKKQALLFLVQAGLSLSPTLIRPYVNRFLIYLRPKVNRLLQKKWKNFFGRYLRKMSLNFKNFSSSSILDEKSEFSIFSPGDVLISVGLDWNYPYYREFYNLKKNNDVKIVTCCYDLIPVIYPQYCVNDVAGIFASYFIEIADSSNLILCISKQSEKDLNEMLDRTGGARVLTQVFSLGDNVPVVCGESLTEQVEMVLKEKFILYVSTIERRKNHEVLYRAYHLLCKQDRKAELPKLVFVGMQGWGVGDLFKDIELDPMMKNMIIQLNHVEDHELRRLYESALFCVFPSLYEGWGLPVGEALAMGKVVLSSNQGSLPEVGGDLVRYVDPWNPYAWADELYRVSTDNAWRLECEQKIRDAYIVRTWSEAAKSVKNSLDMLNN